ncbi:I78 family peptidase inhibitor [Roseinatronobacter alkalisoli]|uniref:I78 family peptidase inhibitor n=1 Tax=Roseinatronobacter alkalisoli TaxID=3028235 RepID=A0ABT5T5I3_9RHOB|nr:I78 family peptidase inhibitor [Roseinatronobacter sp. HJB301]MDD7970373.1 I78 family peptidase inhibitor [Roseinatronobacter sp. HJB301]
MRLIAPILGLALLAACQSETPDPAPDMEASCGADDLQSLISQPLAQFQGHPDAEATRVIAPGTAVTMDFRPDRLNVEHDADLIITRIYCG